MARSFDIAELMTSDGEYISDQVRRKINGNFRRICQMMQQELPAQQQQSITAAVTAIVDNVLDIRLPDIESGLFDDLAPVGSVIVTYTSSDPRLSHGTWEQIGEGRYVRAAGSGIAVGDEGGTDEVTLSLTQMPYGSDVIEGAGAGTQRIPIETAGVEQEPVSIEPPYISLLFYRRLA